MRYISAYSKSAAFKRIFTIMQIVVLLVPVLVLLFMFVFLAMLGKNLPTIPFQFYFSMFLMIAMATGTYLLVRFMLQRFTKITVEVSSLGIHQLAPGKEKTISWQDVIEAKKVPYSRTTQVLRIKTANARYVFAPYLVPDTPDAPLLKFGFAKQYWQYPDGKTEPFDVEHSFGLQIVKQYRPDLLPG